MVNNLTSVKIPNSVKKINSYAFSSNDLTSVDIPDGVVHIGDDAFSSNDLKSVEIPDGVAVIGKRAFSGNRLRSVRSLPASLSLVRTRLRVKICLLGSKAMAWF